MSSAGVPAEAGTSLAPATRASARSQKRPAIVSFGWTFRDYAKRVWDNSSEDNVLFLAGGIAFNILLAAVPFFLLLIAGVTYLLPVLYRGKVDSSSAVSFFIDRLLPAHEESPTSPIHKLVTDILRTRTTFTIYGAIGFVWFSTRLFGSLRTVLAEVFDIEHERGIIQGKLFDIQLTIVATLLFVASTALNTYLSIVTRSGVQFLGKLGLQHDVMGGVEYWTGRALAFVFIGERGALHGSQDVACLYLISGAHLIDDCSGRFGEQGGAHGRDHQAGGGDVANERSAFHRRHTQTFARDHLLGGQPGVRTPDDQCQKRDTAPGVGCIALDQRRARLWRGHRSVL